MSKTQHFIASVFLGAIISGLFLGLCSAVVLSIGPGISISPISGLGRIPISYSFTFGFTIGAIYGFLTSAIILYLKRNTFGKYGLAGFYSTAIMLYIPFSAFMNLLCLSFASKEPYTMENGIFILESYLYGVMFYLSTLGSLFIPAFLSGIILGKASNYIAKENV